MEEDDKTIFGKAAMAVDSSNKTLFEQQTIFLSNLTLQNWNSPPNPKPNFLIQHLMHLCMNREEEIELEDVRHQSERSQTVIVDPAREPSHNELL